MKLKIYLFIYTHMIPYTNFFQKRFLYIQTIKKKSVINKDGPLKEQVKNLSKIKNRTSNK